MMDTCKLHVLNATQNPKTPKMIREAGYTADAPRQTVSLSINSDLFAKVKALGINASRFAEQALAEALEQQRRTALAAEVRLDLDAARDYVEQHGSCSEMARQHYQRKTGR
jgi:antitoxin CcdA